MNALTSKNALRAVLADGRWHPKKTLQRDFGPALQTCVRDLHLDMDIKAGTFPVHVEVREDGAIRHSSRVRCSLCGRGGR